MSRACDSTYTFPWRFSELRRWVALLKNESTSAGTRLRVSSTLRGLCNMRAELHLRASVCTRVRGRYEESLVLVTRYYIPTIIANARNISTEMRRYISKSGPSIIGINRNLDQLKLSSRWGLRMGLNLKNNHYFGRGKKKSANKSK